MRRDFRLMQQRGSLSLILMEKMAIAQIQQKKTVKIQTELHHKDCKGLL